jgi:starch phosphorylase
MGGIQMLFDNKEVFVQEFKERAEEKYGRDPKDIDITEVYDILGTMVRDYMNISCKQTKDKVKAQKAKQLVYFSMEFLIGKMLEANMVNLGIKDIVADGFREMGLDLKATEDQEADAGEGNGGLGRLAACFMDSIASLGLAGHGNCIRYDYGFFRQRIRNGRQEELPDQWLLNGNVWEIRKPKHAVVVKFYGQAETYLDDNGEVRRRTVNAVNVLAIPCDVGVIGYRNGICNTLRLWTAEPSSEEIPANTSFNEYVDFVRNITHGLYPDDTTEQGKMLRLRQQYFLVSAGLQSTLRGHFRQYHTFDNLPDCYVFQLNDTHPILAIPELMRLLMDEHDYSWDDAYEICHKCFAFTNHTVMPEALEKWPVDYIASLFPRVYMIIEEINRRQLIKFHQMNLPQSSIDNDIIIKDGFIRMCQLAINVVFSVNGVAELHTKILETQTFKDLYQLYPEKFTNKTNGITHRRWFIVSNPSLAQYVTSLIGEKWIGEPEEGLKGLLKYKDDEKVLSDFYAIKQANKKALVDLVKKENGIDIDPNSIFDAQIKRLHAYKRQLLNVFRIIYYYQELKSNPSFRLAPHTYIFGAKAAPSYVYAKKIIELILAVGQKVNSDPYVSKFMKVVFIENYGVSKAQVIIPATDISEQISTAGKEASGTSNMKFMMNGAVTLGTYDGANVEISRLVGKDNCIIFGLKAEEVDKLRFEGDYSPWTVFNSYAPARSVINSLIDGTFDSDKERFRMIYSEIMERNDEYFILKDFASYLEASAQADKLYADRMKWEQMCLVNVAESGYFSSDRTIREYNRDIWHLPKIS